MGRIDVVRESDGLHWRAIESGSEAGEVRAWVRPDARLGARRTGGAVVLVKRRAAR